MFSVLERFLHSVSRKTLLGQSLILWSYSTGILETSKIRASVIEDMKSRRAKTTALSTLYPRQFNTAGKMLVRHLQSHSYWGSVFLIISAWLLIAAAYTSKQKARGQTSLLAASVLHARTLHASTQDTYWCTCVWRLKRVGEKCACALVAGTQDIPW